MSDHLAGIGKRLQSLIDGQGKLTIYLEDGDEGLPGEGELLIRVEAAPINPSDIGTLLGPTDVSSLMNQDGLLTGAVPVTALGSVAGRLEKSMPVGLEGAGTIVAAGPGLGHLVGRVAATMAGGVYAHYRRVRRDACMILPEGTSARDAASSFVNPLTALSMPEVMRQNGHNAIVHTAAASNLGQMLARTCAQDGIGLVNIVRSSEQAALLRSAGAQHICDSSLPEFDDMLADAIAATGASIAFDAIGGGTMAGRILWAMEAAISRRGGEFSRYGSTTMKQLFIYSGLDRSPTVIDRSFGVAWSAGGWLLTSFLETLGPERTGSLHARIAANATGTFSSAYDRELSLDALLDADNLIRVASRGTGKKALVRSHMGMA